MKTFRKNSLKIIMPAGLLMILLATACAVPTPVVQTVEVTRLVPQVVIATFVIQETVLVTSETTSVAVSTASLTSTPTPTFTPTVTPESQFPSARLNSYGFRGDGTFFVTVDTGKTLTGEYRARIDQSLYDCVIPAKYPERLYCYGILDRYGRIVELQIYTDDASKTIVFETEFSAPLKPTKTPTPTITPTPTEEPAP